MFAIALKEEQYKTYVLTDGTAQSRLEVVPERGGIITRWSVNQSELLYLDEERFANPEMTVRGGIPILFPICGNLPDNTYTYNGHTYTLKQHGFARNLPWKVVERITHDRAGIRLSLTSTDETLAVYPFDFELVFTYWLSGHTLGIHQRVVNRSAEPLPFSLGLHPYFQVSNKEKLQFQIPATEYQNQMDGSVHSFAGDLDFSQDEIDVAFKQLSDNRASVMAGDRSLQLTLESDPLFSTLVFWTVKGKDYYCLEPWSAPRNALNTGEQLTYLDPGATLDASVRLTASQPLE